MADDKDKTSLSSNEDEIDGLDENRNGSWDISLEVSTMKRQLKVLDYFTTNGLHQAFNVLDAKQSGRVAKTQLQILCINLCTVINVPFSGDDLNQFESDSTDLTFEEFHKYITATLLPKISIECVDLVKLDEISWTIVGKLRKQFDVKTLKDNELFQIWQAFNKINIDRTVEIDVEEAALLLDDFMRAIGIPWSRGPLDVSADGKKELNFWKLMKCLEDKYLHNTTQSVYACGITAVYDKYVREIIKCGILVKRGHRIKSLKERWFVLNPKLMSYYEGKNDQGKKKGVIVLNKNSKCETVEDKSNKCRFTVGCGGEKKREFLMEANDPKTRNEWVASIQKCIDCAKDGFTPLMKELSERAADRRVSRLKHAEEEKVRREQEETIRRQLEELELIKQARDEAKAQAENEAAQKDEERKRREELETLKAEYEKLLEEERQAREVENQAREKQQKILEEEMLRRQELETIKAEQDCILQEERKAREGLEEISKEQQKALEQERERLKELDAARQAAEEQVEASRAKLEAAEEERRVAAKRVEDAKAKTRNMKVPNGLAKPLILEQAQPSTHRGAGAFVTEDFSKVPLYLSKEERPVPVNQGEVLPEKERSVIEETHLVKPSVGKETFEGNSI